MLAVEPFSGFLVTSPMTITPPVWGRSVFGFFPHFSGHRNSSKNRIIFGFGGPTTSSIKFPLSSVLNLTPNATSHALKISLSRASSIAIVQWS